MNAREELERVKFAEFINKEFFKYFKQYDLKFGHILAQSILAKLPELGFVRLEEVEIDEKKLYKKLMEEIKPHLYRLTNKDLAHAIAEAKGILRVKKK